MGPYEDQVSTSEMPGSIFTASTGAKHPRLLQAVRNSEDNDGARTDELRRLAIHNSINSRCGTPHPSTGRFLPPLFLKSKTKSSPLVTGLRGANVAVPQTDSPLRAKNASMRSPPPVLSAGVAPTSLPKINDGRSGRARAAPPHRPKPRSPCSTTALDFHRHSGGASRSSGAVSRCRANNPHPVGLVFQSPYNRHSKAFEIWNPDIDVIESRLPQMLKHIEKTNFSCGPVKPHVPGGRGGPPHVHYSTASMYRYSYQQPQRSSQYDSKMPTTRFGSTPRHCNTPAVGVVPNVMTLRNATLNGSQPHFTRKH